MKEFKPLSLAYLALIFCAIGFIAECLPPPKPKAKTEQVKPASCDTLKSAYEASLNDHTNRVLICQDSLFECRKSAYLYQKKCDSLHLVCDSLNKSLFLSNYKITQAKYYLKICINNPSQDRFLKGWMRRALE